MASLLFSSLERTDNSDRSPITTEARSSLRRNAKEFTIAKMMKSMATSGLKRTRDALSRQPRIGTHDGAFHCDEALGCWMLKKTDLFRDAEITRTRKEEVLKDLDAVLDVGGVYDAEHYRFDHHQKGFDEAFGHGQVTKH